MSHYSYAVTVGAALKWPLPRLCCNRVVISDVFQHHRSIFAIIPRTTRVAFDILKTVIAFIPCAALYLMGSLILKCGSLQIDASQLPRLAKKVPTPRVQPDAFQRLLELSNNDELRMAYNTFTSDQCRLIRRDFKDDFRMKEFERYLSGIVDLLESEKQSQKDRVISELADALEVCLPTWVEKARKLYEELCDAGTPEDNLLREVESYKEEIITDFFQRTLGFTQWHYLNGARVNLGREIGIRQELANTDQYVTQLSFLQRFFVKWCFWTWYNNANLLIEAVTNRIQLSGKDMSYYMFFNQKLSAKNSISNADSSEEEEDHTIAYIESHFYRNRQITKEGVAFMLKEMGILR